MKRFYTAIVRRRRLVLAVFAPVSYTHLLADAAEESARTRTELGLYERPEEAGEGEE